MHVNAGYGFRRRLTIVSGCEQVDLVSEPGEASRGLRAPRADAPAVRRQLAADDGDPHAFASAFRRPRCLRAWTSSSN